MKKKLDRDGARDARSLGYKTQRSVALIIMFQYTSTELVIMQTETSR